jgi:hypothetical protein
MGAACHRLKVNQARRQPVAPFRFVQPARPFRVMGRLSQLPLPHCFSLGLATPGSTARNGRCLLPISATNLLSNEHPTRPNSFPSRQLALPSTATKGPAVRHDAEAPLCPTRFRFGAGSSPKRRTSLERPRDLTPRGTAAAVETRAPEGHARERHMGSGIILRASTPCI